MEISPVEKSKQIKSVCSKIVIDREVVSRGCVKQNFEFPEKYCQSFKNQETKCLFCGKLQGT